MTVPSFNLLVALVLLSRGDAAVESTATGLLSIHGVAVKFPSCLIKKSPCVMFGTFFKSAENPLLFRTMAPHVNIFLESNDLASDTDVKKLW